jgi:HSP20 family molecular chaperone IbpA
LALGSEALLTALHDLLRPYHNAATRSSLRALARATPRNWLHAKALLTDDALHLETELPGLEMKDLEIFVTGHTQLTLKGERKPVAIENAVQHRQERGFGSFVRSLTLPVAVDENKIEANF